MKILINYADSLWKPAQHFATKMAYKRGVDKVIEYGPEDISKEFREKNSYAFVQNNKRVGKYGPVSYTHLMDEALLLEGVTAVDEKDGDVSDSLLVEKVAGTNGKEVIVTYVARDGANNVGKASRAFKMCIRDRLCILPDIRLFFCAENWFFTTLIE